MAVGGVSCFIICPTVGDEADGFGEAIKAAIGEFVVAWLGMFPEGDSNWCV